MTTSTSKGRKPQKGRAAFGWVRELPSKRFQASYTGLDGKRYLAPHTFDTKTDARGWLAIQQASIHQGQWSATDAARTEAGQKAKGVTFGPYAERWIATRINRHGEPLRPRTRVENERLLRSSLAAFADQRVTSLTPAAVRDWYSDQMATGKKTQAARAYGLLNSILATAAQDGIIKVNPCMVRGAQNATTGRKVTPPTPTQLQTIFDSITPRYVAAVAIAAWASCRFGELTELRRKDILVTTLEGSVKSVTIGVSRAVTHTTGLGFIVGKTKSEAGVRVVTLPPHMNDVIVQHLRENVGPEPDSLLFPAADGISHLAQSTFVKHWYPARRAAGREDMPFHALRHYGATRFAQTGATLKEIQERLGHSTVEAAMRYQHTAGRDEELAARMSELAAPK
ncbi:tyrosine-type recombinase/integrase [Agreia sp. PsM10]|uniref:tyrosine-type recombinase/integrase n=1 Tax=Agreia sp. PsM10 TaxID=3030533 RepID=UPI00263B203D|nr:tyrosine-type recombinase/integrase [Agreia sp. PsM10]MDN4639692.1 tyrosine-type recombinase/integrase [Agreia sp. PsM10]